MLDYTLKTFLRHASNEHLAEYFARLGGIGDIDIRALKKMQIEPIFEALCDCNELVRYQAESEFQDIHTLANAAGMITLQEEADYHGIELGEEFHTQLDYCAKAFCTFLHHPQVFKTALSIAAKDHLPLRYLRKRQGLPRLQQANFLTGKMNWQSN